MPNLTPYVIYDETLGDSRRVLVAEHRDAVLDFTLRDGSIVPAIREDFTGEQPEHVVQLLELLGSKLSFMVRMCSGCRRVLGIRRVPLGFGGCTTHGICSACSAAYLAEFRAERAGSGGESPA